MLEDGRIFVSIAAYADPELPATMMSLLAAADRPELISFGLVPWWQLDLLDLVRCGKVRAAALKLSSCKSTMT